MSERENYGFKRIKLFHSSSNPNDTATFSRSESASSPQTSSDVSQLQPETERPEVATRRRGWSKLGKFREALSATASSFGPLKSAIDNISQCLELFESEFKGREEYQRLKVELESLFGDLCNYFDQYSPVVTPIVTRAAEGIQKEIKLLVEKQERKKATQYLEASENEDEILQCYRHIQGFLRRVTLNVEINILKIVDEQTTDMRLSKLPNSSAATYASAESDGLRRGECTPNTRAQVLQQMHDWAYDPQGHKIYWLNGMAGTGKTTIAYSLCVQLDRTRKLAASFFCSRQLPKCRNVNRIIPSIAYQLSMFSRSFRRALADLLEENPEAHNQTLSRQFEQLIVRPLQEVNGVFPSDRVIVIDALDECDDKDSVDRLLNVILTDGTRLPVKFVVTSRPEPKILDRMRREENNPIRTELRLHELERTVVQDDIRTYLTVELSSMRLTFDHLGVLVERSGVLFIYAATVVRYVGTDNFSRGAERLKEVLDIRPSSTSDANREIDGLYTAILKSAFHDPSLNSLDKIRMKAVLHTILFAQEPLRLDTLADLASLNNQTEVKPALRPLLSVLHLSEATQVVTILHESFPNYITHLDRSQEFHCDDRLYNVSMARMCFDVMDKPNPPFNICGFESSCMLDKDVKDLEAKIQAGIPDSLHYACRYWGAHIREAAAADSIIDRLDNFLQSRLLMWLEVLNLKKCLSEGARTMDLANQVAWCSDEAHQLMKDGLRFITVLSAGDILESTPHIYVSGLTFWPQSRPISKHYTRHRHSSIAIDGPALKVLEFSLASMRGESEFTSLSYLFDGTRIISGSNDGNIRVWNAYTGQKLGRPLKAHNEAILSVAYSPDGARIVSSSQDGSIAIWNAHTNQQIGHYFERHKGPVYSVAYSPNGACLVSGSADGTICIWNAKTGQMIKQSLQEHNDAVLAVGFSPDSGRIISGSGDTTLRIWSVQTCQPIGQPLEGHIDSVRTVSYSPNGKLVASGSDDHTIRIWESRTGKRVREPLRGHGSAIHTLAFSSDSLRIVSGSEHGAVCIWDACTGQNIGHSLEGHTRTIRSVAYSPDCARIISASSDQSMRIWNAPTVKQTENLELSPEWHTHGIRFLRYSPDGLNIIAYSYDQIVQTWDARSGREKTELQIQKQRIFSWASKAILQAYSTDGSRAVFSYKSGAIIVQDVYSGEEIATFLLPTGVSAVKAAAYSFDKSHIVVFYKNNTVWIWETKPAKAAQMFRYTGDVTSAAYSPDATSIAAGSSGGDISIWSAVTVTGQRQTRTLTNANGVVTSLSYSVDNTRIVSGSNNGTLTVWNVLTGQQLYQSIQVHTGTITSVACSPCGRYMVSASEDCTIRVWYLPSIHEVSESQICVTELPSPTLRPSLFSSHDDSLNQSTDFLQLNLSEDSDYWQLRPDGWVVDNSNNLLVWVPLDVRRYLMPQRNVLTIARRNWLKIDLSTARFCKDW